MSKHINFVCNDILYSNIVNFMGDKNISNLSSAIRILLYIAFDSMRKEVEKKLDEEDISF